MTARRFFILFSAAAAFLYAQSSAGLAASDPDSGSKAAPQAHVPESVWEQVPPGGSLQQSLDGGFVIRDRSMNVIKNIPASKERKPLLSSEIPEQVRGRIPPQGSWAVMPDGTYLIRDRLGKVASIVPREGGESILGVSTVEIETENLPDGATMTHMKAADGKWKHQFRKQMEDGRVLDYSVEPGDPLYPDGHPRYDSGAHKTASKSRPAPAE